MMRIAARGLRLLVAAGVFGSAAVLTTGCYDAQPEDPLMITVDVEPCPGITGLTVLPLEVIVGGEVMLTAEVVGEATLSWSAESGAFGDRAAPETYYRCLVPGKQTLSLTLAEGASCEEVVKVDVTCSGSPYCGDGILDFGEQCDDGNEIEGDSCSMNCKSAVPVPVN